MLNRNRQNIALSAFGDTLTRELVARSALRADIWATRYRTMTGSLPGPFTFDYHPWTREMLVSDHPECVGQKAAQMGFTDSVGLNRCLFVIDRRKQDVLYILPAQTPDARDFSSGRFGPALESSPYLKKLFTSVDNVGMKRTATNVLYVRGSRSRSQLKSIPVSLIFMDEVDEFDPEAIRLAEERTSGQKDAQIWYVSTPSVPDYGVNKLFRRSDQRHFFFPCPRCADRVELTYPDCLTITADSPDDPRILDSYIHCPTCKAPFSSDEKQAALLLGEWVPAYRDKFIHGYKVNQLYSNTLPVYKFAIAALRAKSDPVEEQEFHNSKLGEEHIVAGHSLDPSHIKKTDLHMRAPAQWHAPITMGIDVGKLLHVEVDSWSFSPNRPSTNLADMGTPFVLWAGTVQHFSELDDLMYLFKPQMTVIDAQPETRMSLAFCRRFPEITRVCYYSDSQAADVTDSGERISVNRTASLDRALGRFFNGSIILPCDLPDDYVPHLCHLVRKPERNKLNDITFRYLNTGPDHFAHSRTYSELAMMVMPQGSTRPIC